MSDPLSPRGQLVTAHALAERLNVAPETILKWTREGRIPAVYLSSRAVRFDPDEIAAWLEQRRAAPSRGGVANPGERRPLGILASVANPDHEENPDAR